MKSKIARSFVAILAGSVLSLASTGMVAASGADNGSGSSSTQTAGSQVLQLRDQLTSVAYAGDVAATKDTLNKLNPLLAELSAGQRYAVSAEAQNSAEVAKGQSADVTRALADPAASQQLPPTPGVFGAPPLPDPLNVVNGALQSLLTSLSNVLNNLLGSAPPLPEPGLPAPGLPTP